jgi:hypothetical protein
MISLVARGICRRSHQQLVVVRPALVHSPHQFAGADHHVVEAAHLVRLGLRRPHPAIAIGEAVAAAQLAEGVAAEGLR